MLKSAEVHRRLVVVEKKQRWWGGLGLTVDDVVLIRCCGIME